jgi:hypothetical protein
MIALFLLLSAQAAEPAPAAARDPTPPPAARRVCVQAPGSDTITCRPAPQQTGNYRLPRYGPAAPGAQSDRGDGVRLRGQASNRGRAGRNRTAATLGIPF